MRSFLAYLLWPLSMLYMAVASIRNWLFDKNLWLKSKSYDKPIICVGNLSVGGTGKTPMVEHLLRILTETYNTAVLSRGYGRSTQGYRAVDDAASADTVGDEPFQLYQKFKDKARFYVCEKRVLGLDHILAESDAQVVVLDDAFQHRYVKASLYILLTDYSRLFVDDWVLPAGRLRESRKGARRADIVVVTKCPESLDADRQSAIREKIQGYTRKDVPIFFSKIVYDDIKVINGLLADHPNMVLVTGIANPQPIKNYVSSRYTIYKNIEFADHHAFVPAEVDQIAKLCKGIEDVFLLTTEKDFQRLLPFKDHLQGISLGYLPIKIAVEGDGHSFDKMISNHCKAMS